MTFGPQKHHRRSIRLPGHNYSHPESDFVTVATLQRECLFGEIVDGEMGLNQFEKIVKHAWWHLPERYDSNSTSHSGP
jgi:hypothetical protein